METNCFKIKLNLTLRSILSYHPFFMMQTKALYNLLRLQAAEDPTVEAEAWALEDLRQITPEEIFSRLAARNVHLDKLAFVQFAENCDTPEDLAELLLPDQESEESYDPLYLLVFELWRRLLPEKQSLSIFGDELDHRIALYSQDDQENLESDEEIQDALANLLEVLDENADAGADPQEVFLAVSDYCAHDLESFIVDYIVDILDSENEPYASELIEGFTPYVSEPIWFDFLRARLASFKDIAEANRIIHRILENEPEPTLLMEILNFLAGSGEHELFVAAVKKILPLLKTEEELLEVMEIAADYYGRLDQDAIEQSIQKLMQKRKSATGPLNPSDPDLKLLNQLLVK